MTLAHDRRGSGEPLLLLHGFGSRRRVWDRAMPLLAAERETIAVDLPGFGESPADVEHPTPWRLAERVAAFMDGEGIEHAHVAGFSMGGWIALELSKLGRALSACAICPAGFWNRWEREYCRRSLSASRTSIRLLGRALPALSRRAAARRALNRQMLERGDALRPDEAVEQARAYASSPGFDATLDALHEGRFTGAAQLRGPVTVAWGDRDKLLLPRQAERARRALPRARHLCLQGCGHVPMVDDPATTARAILTSA